MAEAPKIDNNLCTMCGLCIEICPRDAITVVDGELTTLEGECILCSHCYAVCDAGAISFDPDVLRAVKFRTIRFDDIPRRNVTPADFVNFSMSRRSVRKYREIPLSDNVLADLVDFAVTAPSGSNCQNWCFTVINGRDKVFELANKIRRFFERLNVIVRNPVTRYLSILFAGKKLLKYYKNHYNSVEMGLNEAAKGRDLLFHGAPAVILVHGGTSGSTPFEDGQYAAYNIALLAHALGLGTCFIGYAKETIKRSKGIRAYLGIPAHHRILAVLTVGFPAVEFGRFALRKEYPVRFF